MNSKRPKEYFRQIEDLPDGFVFFLQFVFKGVHLWAHCKTHDTIIEPKDRMPRESSQKWLEGLKLCFDMQLMVLYILTSSFVYDTCWMAQTLKAETLKEETFRVLRNSDLVTSHQHFLGADFDGYNVFTLGFWLFLIALIRSARRDSIWERPILGTTSLPTITDVTNSFEYSTTGMLNTLWQNRNRFSITGKNMNDKKSNSDVAVITWTSHQADCMHSTSS